MVLHTYITFHSFYTNPLWVRFALKKMNVNNFNCKNAFEFKACFYLLYSAWAIFWQSCALESSRLLIYISLFLPFALLLCLAPSLSVYNFFIYLNWLNEHTQDNLMRAHPHQKGGFIFYYHQHLLNDYCLHCNYNCNNFHAPQNRLRQ